MSAGFRRPDSRGRLLVPPAVRNNAADRTSRGRSSNKISGNKLLLPRSSLSPNSPKYHRLRQREEQHHQQTYVFRHVDTAEEEDEDEDNDDDDEEEIEVFEMPEIRSRRNQGSSKKSDFSFHASGGFSEQAYLQHQVTDGDTVQSLSIKYACPISELKRVNHLIRDQDLFGLKHIKVPIKKYGIISENCAQSNILVSADATQLPSSQKGCLDRHNESHFNNCETWTDTDSEMPLSAIDEVSQSCNLSDPDTQRRVIHTLSIKDMMQSQTKEAEEFLRNMDRDLEILRESTRTNRHSLDEVISVLTNKSIQPLNKGSGSLCSGDGADCGLRYKNILAAEQVEKKSIYLSIYLSIYHQK
ncbi:unnamed protein product [Acanthosepion pharaonis]|uniref:LysM domain-containing protein n=1 Tax=Acanthosepion pharaonis TaxID=158019 RepID=A0A812CKT5_ACAPH|nr:unnamed protein product [Sepia pharaonis]